jgi:hypothetical protein
MRMGVTNWGDKSIAILRPNFLLISWTSKYKPFYLVLDINIYYIKASVSTVVSRQYLKKHYISLESTRTPIIFSLLL